MTYYDTALQTIPGRDIRRPAPTKAQQIAKLEQQLEECSYANWTQAWKDAKARLEALKAEG